MMNVFKVIQNRLKKEAKIFLHRGDKYICPFCDYASKDLAPMGADMPILIEKQIIGGGRRLAECYKCGSSDRERLIYTLLKDEFNIFDSPDQSILHVAPERNLSNKLLRFGFKNYVCGDLFTEGYSYPKHVQNLNVLDIPYPENTFDLIICNHVLEHIPTDVEAMKELRRALKIGGKAILQVPISKNTTVTHEDFSINNPQQRLIMFGQFDHCRIYGRDYEDRLKQAGFKVSRINISKKYPKYGLNVDEDIFVGEK